MTIPRALFPMYSPFNTQMNDNCDNKHNDQEELSIFYINIQSLVSKNLLLIKELQDYLPVNIICVAEHWCSDTVSMKLDGYKLITSFVRSEKSRGGVGIFIEEDATATVIDVKNLCIESNFEACAIKCLATNQKVLNSPVVVAAVYRTPESNFDIFLSKLDEMLLKLSIHKCDLFLTGDFNVWMHDNDCKENIRLRSMIGSLNMELMLNNVYTRIRKTSSTLLDNCITNNVDAATIFIDPSLSDHAGFKIKANLPNSFRKEPKMTRVFNRLKLIKF